MKCALFVLILVIYLCGLLGSNSALKIEGPRWIYEGGAAKYTCPTPSHGTVRDVTWNFRHQLTYQNNIYYGFNQVYISEYGNQLRVDEAASQGLDLVVQNVSMAANRGELECTMWTGRGHRTGGPFIYSTRLKVTAGEEPHIRVYAESIDEHMAAITCQVPHWKEFRGLYVDAEKVAADRLESLKPAGGARFVLNLTQFARTRGDILTVECGSSAEGGYPEFSYHKFKISPNTDGGHEINLMNEPSTALAMSSDSSTAGGLAGSTLLLATFTFLLPAGNLPDSMFRAMFGSRM